MADRHLQIFHAVAKHLSFTQAAEALFMTQPALTFQVKQLEEQFDARLFDRGHGQISLTESGRVRHLSSFVAFAKERLATLPPWQDAREAVVAAQA